MKKLAGKNILLGITGSISAFKGAALASKLTQQGAHVDVVATANAIKFVGTATFEALTHNTCYTDTFADVSDSTASHVSIGTRADLAIIAPCSANMIGKIAHGIADDKLSTTLLAIRCPMIVVPAMNCYMFENPAVQENLYILRQRGIHVVDPENGNLACGYSGKGRMPEPETLLEIILQSLAIPRLLAGKRVLVTAGATREHIDAVRFISNPSTGKMGYACARAALMAGADVTLVSAPSALPPIVNAHMINVVSAADMAEAVFEQAPQHDIVIMAAAVSDFTPRTRAGHKIHKSDAQTTLELMPTVDILAKLGADKKNDQFLCGFCMETDDLISRAKLKLSEKNLDMIVANSLSSPGTGFAGDTNAVTILTKDREMNIELSDKLDIAMQIIQKIAEFIV